jgi:nucleoside 2-deoxyribosyltransferase
VDVQGQGSDIKRAAILQDKFDVVHCSAVLMNLTGAVGPSIGTMVELGWADAIGKPVVVVMDVGNPHDHGFVTTLAMTVVKTLEEGIERVIQVVERQ